MDNPFRLVSHRIRRQFRQLRRTWIFEVYAFWRRRPVASNVVCYESFGGNGMLCNPEAIFRGLRASPDFGHLKHVWVLTEQESTPAVVHEFANDPSVRFVTPGSRQYLRALATSKHLINNATFPTFFSKRLGQVYVNTWHGTPLKQMGYDIGDPPSRVANVIRNFLSADYLLAANGFMVEQMYEKAHLLRNVYRGEVIVEGYPRIDAQFMDAAGVQQIRDRLEASGLSLDGRKIVLYAPTWKGTSFDRPTDDARELIHRVNELQSLLDSNEYVVLLKSHQVVHKFAAGQAEFHGRLVPNEIPTNAVLAATDILVTDYSSIFFDFLASGRPIVFLTPDIVDYAGYRGLYMEPEEWPGPVVQTVAQLAAELNFIMHSGPRPGVVGRYATMREKYAPYEDGLATERIIDIVFRGKRAGYRVGAVRHDDRPSILMSIDTTMPGQITTTAVNLLNSVDHSRFDVSVVFPYTRQRAAVEQQSLIDPAVRQLARVGGMSGSKITHFVRKASWFRGSLSAHAHHPVHRRLWDDEWTRCFGSSRFDFTVDYSGCGPFWATLMLHAPGAERSIWLHDDMAVDPPLRGHSRNSHKRTQSGIFTLYSSYDHLVSASPAMAESNARKFAEYAPIERFVFASSVLKHTLRADSPTEPFQVTAGTEHAVKEFYAAIGAVKPHETDGIMA